MNFSNNQSFIQTEQQEKNGSSLSLLEAQVEKMAQSCQKAELLSQHLQAQLDNHKDKIQNFSRVVKLQNSFSEAQDNDIEILKKAVRNLM